MRTKRITHWISTGLLGVMLLMSAGMYLFRHEMIKEAFTVFGFPTWLVYPLAVAKILGVAALILKFNKTIVEWAYAGIFFNIILAVGAHLGIGDNAGVGSALMALMLWLGSYVFWKFGWNDKQA
ncbi:MAG: hypothetical protein A3D92_11890 [Bacteroidetes bacterium RIFCSPHIGHO2_02_FULL_44_7]|nr:MAG: hypothetical protein A3D92_11890 [Bacteroidetes bacterium RIFCSPHIGHO2_02_FULL_44_7]